MTFCEYKDLFGEPGKGIREWRIFNLSIVDVVGAIILGLILSKLFNTSKIGGVFLSFILGLIFHKLFCVETTLNKLIFNF